MHIDWTRCDGRGLCTELLPEALGRDEWGYPVAAPGRVRSGRDATDVPLTGAELAAAMDAENLCPLLALRIIRP
nr:ferredoxin [Arthrobacter sp. SDTb3-6]